MSWSETLPWILAALGGGAGILPTVKGIVALWPVRKPAAGATVTVNAGPAQPVHMLSPDAAGYHPGDTGRFDLPPCGAHGARLDGIDARLKHGDECYAGVAEELVNVRIDVAELRTEVRQALHLPPAEPRSHGGGRRA